VTTAFVLARAAGVVLSWFFYLKRPDIPAAIKARFGRCTRCSTTSTTSTSSTTWSLPAARALLGRGLWKGGDVGLIDGIIVNGSARWWAGLRTLASASSSPVTFYHYAFTMIIGVFVADDPLGHARLS
jgi:NADH-quinone oxidoreductase subunit L